MSIVTMNHAMSDTFHKGEDRLAYIAAGDGDGYVSARTVAMWCGRTEMESVAIIDRMIVAGVFRQDGDRVVCDALRRFAEEGEMRPREPRRRPFTVSEDRRQRLYRRDKGACHYCGSAERLSLDHMLPRSRGGDDADSNLITCCRSCNSSKGAKTYDEFVEWLEARAHE